MRWVALLAEGVDRNMVVGLVVTALAAVALLAEGVDRNNNPIIPPEACAWSPSSRRAWIEISLQRTTLRPLQPSPSSRRAWIEIAYGKGLGVVAGVALLAEGVDRNIEAKIALDHGNPVALLAEGVDRN